MWGAIVILVFAFCLKLLPWQYVIAGGITAVLTSPYWLGLIALRLSDSPIQSPVSVCNSDNLNLSKIQSNALGLIESDMKKLGFSKAEEIQELNEFDGEARMLVVIFLHENTFDAAAALLVLSHAVDETTQLSDSILESAGFGGWSLEFQTEFVDGTTVSTSNMSFIKLYPAKKTHVINTQMPTLQELSKLYKAHRIFSGSLASLTRISQIKTDWISIIRQEAIDDVKRWEQEGFVICCRMGSDIGLLGREHYSRVFERSGRSCRFCRNVI